jgi:hypothetical protein
MDAEEFKSFCLSNDPEIVVQQHLIEGSSYFFDKVIGGQEFLFKKEIASSLKVHIRDIVIVGSGKLGFSLKPAVAEQGLYLFKQFDFKKKSDLDVAIVSSTLFDSEMENLYRHTDWYRSFLGRERNDFAKYILKGRFVTRFLPTDFQLSKEIETVQVKYKSSYGRDVNLEIYKSWYYFETYHKNNILSIKVNLLK